MNTQVLEYNALFNPFLVEDDILCLLFGWNHDTQPDTIKFSLSPFEIYAVIVRIEPPPESAACGVGKPHCWSKPAKPTTLTIQITHVHFRIVSFSFMTYHSN